MFHVRDDRPYCERHAIAYPQQKNLRSSNPSPPQLPPSSPKLPNLQRSSNPNSPNAPPPIPTSQRPNLTSPSPSSLLSPQQQTSNSNNNNICHTCKESLDNAKLTSSAFGKNYHSFHFQCFSCHRPLSSRVPGN